MIEVIGAGFGRTGTASLKAALERLGVGPCYHMIEVVEHPERARDWALAARGVEVDWERVFAGYRSTVDWPGAAFWRQLVDRYPDAKVILTVRDPDRWYDSAASTIFQLMLPTRNPVARVLRGLMMPRDPNFRDFLLANRLLILEGTFGGRLDDREEAKRVFLRHNEEVKEALPAERLLVYDVAEGWEPLCAFLGVPVPGEPFPRLNDARSFRRRRRAQMVAGMARPATVVAGAVAAATVLALARRRRR